MRKLLTDAFCRAVDAPQSGRAEFTDLRCAGLAYRVTAKGVRSWAFRFRDPKTRRPTRATIGTYPDVGLGDARMKADALRATVAGGTNPIELKRVQRSIAKDRTVAAVAERFMVEHSRRKKRSAGADDRNLRLHILPIWKSRQIEDIRRADIIALVEGLVQNGTPVLANRVQSLISSIFSFALDNDLIGANPSARLRKRGQETAATRVLSDDELRLFWNATMCAPFSLRTGLALRLQLLTGTRPAEAAEAAMVEFMHLDQDDKAAWKLPSARTKNKKEHLVPLSAMALQVVRSAVELYGPNSTFLFPSPLADANAPIDGHSLATAMRRFGTSDQLIGPGRESWRAKPPTPHDLRRTFATRLSELGVAKEDRDACLNHAPQDVGSRHYDLYQRAKEKRAAVVLFSNSLKEILEMRL